MVSLIENAIFPVNFGLGRGRNRVVFRNPRGNKYYYCIYANYLLFHLVLEYSTNGTDWSNTPQTIYSEAVYDYDVKIYDTGSDLKIFVVIYIANSLIYIRGSLSDAGTTPTWDTAQVITDINIEMTGNQSVAIARTNNGRLVVVFGEDYAVKKNYYRQTKIIGADGDDAAPTWSNETIINDPSSATNNTLKGQCYSGMEAFSSTYPNRVFIYARVPEGTTDNNYQIYTWAYDWNGSSMSEHSSLSLYIADLPLNEYLSGVIDDSDNCHIIYEYEDVNMISKKASTSGSVATWGTQYTVSSAQIDACSLTIDRINDELYAFYHHTADTTVIHYKKTVVGTISWGSEQDINIPLSVDLLDLSSHNSDVENALHIGIYDFNLSYNYTIYYHELSLAPPAGEIDTLLGVSWANVDAFMGIEDTSIDEVMGIDSGE